MHIRERLNVDHVVILILELQDRAAPEAMQGTWAALPPPGLGSISRGAGGGGWGVCVLPLLLSCQRGKRGWPSFLSAT